MNARSDDPKARVTVNGGDPGTPVIGTSYAGLVLGDVDARDCRLVWRFASDRLQSFLLGVEATRREAANHNAEHGVMLQGALRW